jgi:hypothetical protein
MSGFLRQNTAVTVMIGEFLDDSDGKTAKGSLTLTPSDIYLSKNGEAYSGKHEGTNASSDASLVGWYTCPLDDTDTSGSGTLQLAVHVAGALPVWDSWTILPANVYDSITGTDTLIVDASSLLSSTIDSTYNLQQILQVIVAVMAGKVNGGGTSTITFRDLGDGTDRVVATVDSNGNRTNIVIN